MKKILLISLMFLSFCFLSCNKNIMENYVSQDYYNYDFIINNPLFYNESFPDLDEVKCIIKHSRNEFFPNVVDMRNRIRNTRILCYALIVKVNLSVCIYGYIL